MKKSSVEYVICPLIFQYRVTIVSTQVVANMASVTCVNIVSFRSRVRKKSTRYPIVVIVK